jgi:hypothetical protein
MKGILAALLLVTAPLAAHCNCKLHSGGGVHAQHGGEIEITDHHMVVELVVDGPQHTIFVMNEDLQTIPVEKMDVRARILFPRGRGDPQELALEGKGDRLLGGAQLPKRLHRYAVEIDVRHGEDEEQVRFVVEP